MNRRSFLLVLSVCAVFLAGCSVKVEESKEANETAPKEKDVSSPASVASPASEDPIVAEFGDTGRVRLDALLAFTRQKEDNVMPIRAEDTRVSLIKELRMKTLEQLIDSELICLEAERQGIILPEQSLQNTIGEMIQKNYEGSEEKLLQSLSEKGMDMEKLQEALRKRFMTDELVRRTISENVRVDESELEPYYQAHLKEFTRPESADVHFLVIKASSPETKEEARAKIEALRAEIVASLEPVPALMEKVGMVIAFCREHSQDENRQGGSWWKVFGLGGHIDRGLEEAAAEAPLGEFGSIFELEKSPGYVTAFKKTYSPAETQPFEDAKEQIRRILNKERRDKAFADLQERIRETGNIRINEDVLYSQIPEAAEPAIPMEEIAKNRAGIPSSATDGNSLSSQGGNAR